MIIHSNEIYAQLKAETEVQLGTPISLQMFDAALSEGILKLAHIIRRYGDAKGERLERYYLVDLICEAVLAHVKTEDTLSRARARREEEVSVIS